MALSQSELLQGTLDLLILKSLALEQMHGMGISRRIRQITNSTFEVKPGSEKQDVYARVTDKIIADLEKGVRPWFKPWNAGHAAGRITRPLRHNGLPDSGINILMLWVAALEQGYSAPIWMTFKQAMAY